MKSTAVLFDLDGTLLPMDQEPFVQAYFGLLAKKLAPHGYDPDSLIKAIWKGTEAMIRNDGSQTNEDAFWQCFSTLLGRDCRKDEPIFDEYYRTDFQQAAKTCGFAPQAAKIIALCRKLGFRVILATNPIFPAVATQSRIRWAGLQQQDFELVTTYENSRFCKPNPAYYQDILASCGLRPEECLMVGNDVDEDMVAETLGMRVFLLTDCLLNRKNRDISAYPHGSFGELESFLQSLN